MGLEGVVCLLGLNLLLAGLQLLMRHRAQVLVLDALADVLVVPLHGKLLRGKLARMLLLGLVLEAMLVIAEQILAGKLVVVPESVEIVIEIVVGRLRLLEVIAERIAAILRIDLNGVTVLDIGEQYRDIVFGLRLDHADLAVDGHLKLALANDARALETAAIHAESDHMGKLRIREIIEDVNGDALVLAERQLVYVTVERRAIALAKAAALADDMHVRTMRVIAVETIAECEEYLTRVDAGVALNVLHVHERTVRQLPCDIREMVIHGLTGYSHRIDSFLSYLTTCVSHTSYLCL